MHHLSPPLLDAALPTLPLVKNIVQPEWLDLDMKSVVVFASDKSGLSLADEHHLKTYHLFVWS